MVKKKPAAQAKTAENETVKVETKAAEKTTAAEKEAVKEVAKEVVKETAAAEEAPAKADEKQIRICFTAAFNKHKDKGGNEHGESFIEYRSSTRSKRRSGQIQI